MEYNQRMPGKNIIKQDVADSYQHVYARGHSRQKIFVDEQDYITFLNLLERYLSAEEAKDPYGVSYPNFFNKVELLAYCLMPNHVHLLIYIRQPGEMGKFMRSVMTSYSRYFNKKYKRSGSLFESRYKASMISDETYLEHISRYIHLNPKQWRNYDYSSLPYYLQQDEVSWIRPKRILEQFSGPAEYLEFVSDYVEQKKLLKILKQELASEI
jgi:REP element-mobilizing transposase RayT